MSKLFVSDFDNTLIQCDAKSIVINKFTKEKIAYTPAEFKYHEIDHSKYEYDQTQFDVLPYKFDINYTLLNILKHNLQFGDVKLLTARHNPTALNQFLHLQKLENQISVSCLDHSIENPALGKANWFRNELNSKKYTQVFFWDDDIRNLNAVKELRNEYHNVKFTLFFVDFNIPLSCLQSQFN